MIVLVTWKLYLNMSLLNHLCKLEQAEAGMPTCIFSVLCDCICLFVAVCVCVCVCVYACVLVCVCHPILVTIYER